MKIFIFMALLWTVCRQTDAMCFGGGGGDGGAQQARADEAARQARITEGRQKINDVFSQFDDNFYKKREADYASFAQPQLDSQSKEARNELMFSLARSGNMASSEMGKQLGVLEREKNLAQSKLSDAGIAYANQARQQVEQSRGDVLNQLMATSDPSVAASQANARAALANQYNPIVDTLGNLFNRTMTIAGNTNRASMYMPDAPGWEAFGMKNSPRTSAGSQRVIN